MAKIIIYGDIDINPLYISIDGNKELTVSGKYPRCISVSTGTHHIDATTVSKFERATAGVGGGGLLGDAANAITNSTNTSIAGSVNFDNDDVLLIQVKIKGVKTNVYNKVVSLSEANDYVDMAAVLEYGEKAPGEKNKWVVFLLCLLFGWLGVHRFYEKKIVTGIFYLLTMGFCGIGVIIDLLSIVRR